MSTMTSRSWGRSIAALLGCAGLLAGCVVGTGEGVEQSPASLEGCTTIDTTGEGMGAPPEPGDPPNLVRTVAEIDGGLLEGTTTAAFTITDPSTGTFEGTVTFYVDEDEEDEDDEEEAETTLTVYLEGAIDFSTGAFASSGPVIDGTGDLEGATGTILLSGVQAPDGTFTETVTGQVCTSEDDDEDDRDDDEDDRDDDEEDEDEDDDDDDDDEDDDEQHDDD